MAIFNGHVITNAGRNLIGRAMAGEGRVIITRAAMGDGKPSQDIRELTQLISEKITANVADVFNDRGTINLKVQITNSQLEEAFKTEEFGIFAKIEGDEEEILYSYCNAVEADTIPSNSLGDIFVEEHTVYIAFSSNTEVDIYIKEGVVFLTMETANKNYVQTGLVVEGKLSNGRTSLKENGQYQADNGKWYHNIGGNRSWESGKGEADEELIEISYFNLYSEIIKKQNETDSRLLTRAKKIWEAINELFNDKQNKTDSSLLTTVKTVVGAINELFNNKLEKGGYSGNAKNLNDEIVKKASTSQLGRMMVGTGLTADSSGRVSIEETSSRRPVSDAEKATWNGKLNQGTVPNSLNSAEKIVAALQGNGGLKFDPNVLHIGDAGTKRVGYYYLDKLKDGIFECLEETTTTVNDSSKFRDISNKASAERLDNLSTKYFKFKYNESEDQEANSILLLNFINKCLESAKNIDILILGGNNKICSIDAKLIVSRATSVIHLTIWNFLSLTINHLELNSDDNNSITINRSGHNLILWNSSWDLWNSRHNTWNIIGGYWW